MSLAGCSWLDAADAPRAPDPAASVPPVVEPDPSRPTFDNRPGCQAFVAHVNGLDCVSEGARLRPELVCAETLVDGPCDATAFWTCATERTACVDGELVRADLGGCPDPCAALTLSSPSSGPPG